jgi:hypothetical protein
MASEIDIPFEVYPQQFNNANATWSQLNLAPNTHAVSGWLMANGVTADLNVSLAAPVPTYINATPNGALKIRWVTSSTDTATSRTFGVKLSSIQPDTTLCNITTFDIDTTVNDTNNGAGKENEVSLALSSVSLNQTAGRGIRGRIQVVGATYDLYITSIRYVADK